MKITQAQLLRAVPTLNKARMADFVDSFNKYSDTFGITTPLRAVHYLAQVFHESFKLYYTEEIASGANYEGRKDLGNIYKGDGVRFKGRGFLHDDILAITKKVNGGTNGLSQRKYYYRRFKLIFGL